MGITIGSNIASLGAQRELSKTTESLSHTYERLCSGLRINSASDDAAGLAVSLTLNAQSRVLTQSLRHINDGISAVNIANGALNALKTIVTRIGELSEQAANGTYGSSQRQALDNEAQQLSIEYSRVSSTTSFNNVSLLDGNFGASIQIGAGTKKGFYEGAKVRKVPTLRFEEVFSAGLFRLGPTNKHIPFTFENSHAVGIWKKDRNVAILPLDLSYFQERSFLLA